MSLGPSPVSHSLLLHSHLYLRIHSVLGVHIHGALAFFLPFDDAFLRYGGNRGIGGLVLEFPVFSDLLSGTCYLFCLQLYGLPDLDGHGFLD